MHVIQLRQFGQRLLTLIAANATFALKTGLWFRRVRFEISAPDPRQSSPRSGRKST
jgi:hypothetical protein